MILDTNFKSLQVVLGEAKTTNDCDVTASFADGAAVMFQPAENDLVTNGTTPVTAVPAPIPAVQRNVREIRVHNNDTVPHTVTLQLNNGGTIRIVDGPETIAAGGNYTYTPDKIASTGGGSSAAAILLESGSSGEKISVMPAAGLLDGTEEFPVVQSGANDKATGNDVGLLILTTGYATNPLDAVASNTPGTNAQIIGGAGNGTGAGGDITIEAGAGGATGHGGSLFLDAGAGSGAGVGGDISLLPGANGGGGRGNIFATVPTTDPSSSHAVWNDNGFAVLSGNPVNGGATLVKGSAAALTTATALDVVTLTIPVAGKYFIGGQVCFTGGATTTITQCIGSVSATLNTLDVSPGRFGSQFFAGTAFSSIAIGADIAITGFGVILTSTAGQTWHLVAQASFAVSTLSVYGYIFAFPVA